MNDNPVQDGDHASVARPVALAHFATSGQFQQGRPETVQVGGGSSPRCFHMATVCRLTPSREAMSSDPTGSHEMGMATPSHVDRGLTSGVERGYTDNMTCPTCHGYGNLIGEGGATGLSTCYSCGGTGRQNPPGRPLDGPRHNHTTTKPRRGVPCPKCEAMASDG